MKKLFTQIATCFAFLSCTLLGVNAQVYQLTYPDFKDNPWEKGIKLNGDVSTFDEPIEWNSFGTSAGPLANLTTSNKIEKGESGEYGYVSVKSQTIIGIVANGNLTTGIINAGNMKATDPSNFNYTPTAGGERIGSDNFRKQFNGRPDSMVVVLQFIPCNKRTDTEYIAQVKAWIHNGETTNETDTITFRDPGEENIGLKAVACATLNPGPTDAYDDFKRFSVPFDYSVGNEGNESKFLLISAATNKTPGEGGDKTIVGPKRDELRIASIHFIYNTSLSAIKINGTELEGFDAGKTEYEMTGEAPAVSDIEIDLQGKGATYSVTKEEESTFDTSSKTVIKITVKGNDHSDTNPNETVYRLVYPQSTTGIDNNSSDAENVIVYSNNNQVFVKNYSGIVEIYALNGAKVAEKSTNTSDSFTLTSGTYLVRTGAKTTTVIIK